LLLYQIRGEERGGGGGERGEGRGEREEGRGERGGEGRERREEEEGKPLVSSHCKGIIFSMISSCLIRFLPYSEFSITTFLPLQKKRKMYCGTKSLENQMYRGTKRVERKIVPWYERVQKRKAPNCRSTCSFEFEASFKNEEADDHKRPFSLSWES
jgi:hypothetical protein